MTHYKSLSAIARGHDVHRDTVRRWRDSGAITETPSGWPKAEVDRVADDHRRRHEAQSKTRDLRAQKHLLECERLEIAIKHGREILAQEKLRTKRLEAELVPKRLHEEIHDAYTAMFHEGLTQVAAEAGAECPHARPAIIAATEGLRSRL